MSRLPRERQKKKASWLSASFFCCFLASDQETNKKQKTVGWAGIFAGNFDLSWFVSMRSKDLIGKIDPHFLPAPN